MTMPLTDAGSKRLYARAIGLLPGGVNSPVRAMRSIGRDPLFIERGEGAEIVDVDGNRYVDWVCSWGPLVHGHAPAAVVAAIQAAAERGTSFGVVGTVLPLVDLWVDIRGLPEHMHLALKPRGT